VHFSEGGKKKGNAKKPFNDFFRFYILKNGSCDFSHTYGHGLPLSDTEIALLYFLFTAGVKGVATSPDALGI
jgi:hypothetical protein